LGGLNRDICRHKELSEFWRNAYSKLDTKAEDVESTLKNWIPKILNDDGLSLSSSIRKLFSFKPPEPFFGYWVTDDGKLSVEGKTVVALINPGDGITYSQCADPNISLVGRSHWQLLKEFYTTGAIRHNEELYRLLYTRKLRNPSYNYRAGTRHFAWGWWSSQWENMLRAIGETDEDDSFLTLELFAYSSLNANDLNSDTVDALLSSRLTTRLIVDLIQDESARPHRIILVNKRSIWEPLLGQYGFSFIPLKPQNSQGNPKAYRLYFNGQLTQVPVILLQQAQKMKFPTPDNGAREIFGMP
jgi:hypothetical protein